MTIFLTTQYLEEADELADRVGIIDHGRLVAEGSPSELKRRIGTDVIVARIDGDQGRLPVDRLRGLDGVEGVEHRDDELVVQAVDGARTIGPVAVVLHESAVALRDLTLRTPTLDDVFVELTGSRLEVDAATDADESNHDHQLQEVSA